MSPPLAAALESSALPLPDRASFLAFLSQHARLIEIETPLPEAALVAEKFSGNEGISELFRFDIDCLSTSVHFELKKLMGEELTLRLLQADGSKRVWHGIVTEASQLGGDGGLARYRLTLEPWLSALRYRRDCRILQDKNAVEIAQAVFERYPRRRFDVRVGDDLLARLPRYAIATQYRETDLEFVERILARDGLSYGFEHDQSAGAGQGGAAHSRHSLVILDAGYAWPEGRQARIRFHRLSAAESQDSIHSLTAHRKVQPNRVTLAAWDYRQLIAHGAEDSSAAANGELPDLETYTGAGQYRHTSPEDAARLAANRRQAFELASKTFHIDSSVRQLTAGTCFALTEHADFAEGDNRFLVLAVDHEAANNLEPGMRSLTARSDVENGTYRNQARIVRANIPVVPAPRPGPSIGGLASALVVGLDNEPLTTDRDLRLKIQFPWQRGEKPNPGSLQTDDHAPGNETTGTWVRVAQSSAGPNWGAQFTPRIGSEVLVEFIENDPDRPIVVASLHNGQDELPFAAGQESGINHPGVIAGYHTTSLDGQDNAQWLADDAPGQVRSRLAASQNASQANLGYLIHQTTGAQRGAWRGEGFELVTDGWATLRGAQGLFLTTAARPNGQSTQMDAAESVAQLKAARESQQALSDSANAQNAHGLDKKPFDQLIEDIDPQAQGKYTGSIGGQSASKATADARSGGDPVERFASPRIVAHSAAGLLLASPATSALHAGEQIAAISQSDAHLAAAHTVSSVSGKTTSLYTHQGGLQAIAANGPTSLQAHTDKLEVLADKSVTVTSTNDEIEILANSKIRLVAGQSEIVLEGGNINFKCPGTWAVKGASHGFTGPAGEAGVAPSLPTGSAKVEPQNLEVQYLYHDDEGLQGAKYIAKLADGSTRSGATDASGVVRLQDVPAGGVDVQFEPDARAWAGKDQKANDSYGQSIDAVIAKYSENRS